MLTTWQPRTHIAMPTMRHDTRLKEQACRLYKLFPQFTLAKVGHLLLSIPMVCELVYCMLLSCKYLWLLYMIILSRALEVDDHEAKLLPYIMAQTRRLLEREKAVMA